MTRHVRPALAALAVILAVSSFGRAAHAQSRVAVVDWQRVLMEVDEGKAAMAQLKRDFDSKQKSLDAKTQEIQQMQQSLQSQSAVMDPAKLAQKQNELQKKASEAQQTYVMLQTELNQRRQQLLAPIAQKMDTILQQIVQNDGFDVVLDRGAVLYAKDSLDITSEVVRKYNAKYGKGGKKAAPKKKSGKK